MDELIAPSDLPYLIGYVLAAMTLAVLSTLLVGWMSKWRYPRLSAVFGSIVIAAALLSWAEYIIVARPDGPPPNDMKGLAVFGLFAVAFMTFPLTAASSWLAIRQAKRRS